MKKEKKQHAIEREFEQLTGGVVPDEIPEAFQPFSQEDADELEQDLIRSGFPRTMAKVIKTYVLETGPAWASCPQCKQRVVVELPVQKYREKIVTMLIDHLVGRPLEKKQVTIVKSVDDLEQLSDADLANFIAAAGE